MREDRLPLLEFRELELAGINKQSRVMGDMNFPDEVCVTIPIPEHLVKKFSSLDRPVVDGDLVRMQKALAVFQKDDVPWMGKASGIDPFINQTPRVTGAYEYAKTVLLLPLLVMRLLLVAVILAVGYVATKLALAGWESTTSSTGHISLPRWRRKLMGVTRLCGRGLLYCFGYVLATCRLSERYIQFLHKWQEIPRTTNSNAFQ
jgi:lysophosphatidylcholine acyltransferase/lyso-PAF acetyltransferase